MIEYYIPNSQGQHPLILMLHGSAGALTVRTNNEPLEDNFGEKTFAQNCFEVVLPHYLEALGYKSIVSRRQMITEFPRIMEVARASLDKAENLPRVRKRQVFLFGESLGGYLSIALAFERAEIVEVSELSGGLPSGYTLKRKNKPSVLISHGDADLLVPVSEAEALESYCKNHSVPVRLDVYHGANHYLSSSVRTQVLSQTIAFFGEKTRGGGQ